MRKYVYLGCLHSIIEITENRRNERFLREKIYINADIGHIHQGGNVSYAAQ